MTLDDATVAKVAQLARLRLSEAELAMVRGDLAPGVEALRADQPWPSLPQAEVLALAPASAGGHFVVPKVV